MPEVPRLAGYVQEETRVSADKAGQRIFLITEQAETRTPHTVTESCVKRCLFREPEGPSMVAHVQGASACPTVAALDRSRGSSAGESAVTVTKCGTTQLTAALQ